MKIEPKKVTLKDGKIVILRSVKSDDSEDMLKHLTITHTESYKNMNQTADFWKSLSVEKEADILSDFESSDSKFMIVSTHEDKIIGGLGFVGSPGQFHRKNGSLGMSVQNEFSGLGLGTHMLEFSIDTAKNYGFHRMELSVRSYNEAGIALYEKTGFKRIGILKEIAFIDGEYVDEYSYQLIL